MTKYATILASLVTLMLLGMGGCASAADNPAQTIYLDPDTGKVISHPAHRPPAAQSSQRAGGNRDRTRKDSRYKRWTTPEGTHMLSVDPDRTPKERVVRCPDGSLRMGENNAHGGKPDAGGPCQRSIR